ncbi:MAG: peptidoglycan-binding protein [Alphaproteobacteria bacterium]|nr:peptidoglycan-binding protein [Alphaproteobacteria bacterium]
MWKLDRGDDLMKTAITAAAAFTAMALHFAPPAQAAQAPAATGVGSGWTCTQWTAESLDGQGAWSCTQITFEGAPVMGGVADYRMQGRSGKGGQLMQSDVRHLQAALNKLGFMAGPPDGLYGPMTENAIKAFQRSQGSSADGVVWPALFQAVIAALNALPDTGSDDRANKK